MRLAQSPFPTTTAAQSQSQPQHPSPIHSLQLQTTRLAQDGREVYNTYR